MKRHLMYLNYLLRHKWFVFLASIKIRSSIWLAIIHDLSKFLPSEWIPYTRTFYASDGTKQYKEDDEFTIAWNHHQKRNKHHWQYWILCWDRGEYSPLLMQKKYIKEMISDWMGAGRVINGKWEVKDWYGQNKHKMILNTKTREIVEGIIFSM